MSDGALQIFNEKGVLSFDSSTHKLFRYLKTITIDPSLWYRDPNSMGQTSYLYNFEGLDPTKHIIVQEPLLVLYNQIKYFHYNTTALSTITSIDIFGV